MYETYTVVESITSRGRLRRWSNKIELAATVLSGLWHGVVRCDMVWRNMVWCDAYKQHATEDISKVKVLLDDGRFKQQQQSKVHIHTIYYWLVIHSLMIDSFIHSFSSIGIITASIMLRVFCHWIYVTLLWYNTKVICHFGSMILSWLFETTYMILYCLNSIDGINLILDVYFVKK